MTKQVCTFFFILVHHDPKQKTKQKAQAQEVVHHKNKKNACVCLPACLPGCPAAYGGRTPLSHCRLYGISYTTHIGTHGRMIFFSCPYCNHNVIRHEIVLETTVTVCTFSIKKNVLLVLTNRGCAATCVVTGRQAMRCTPVIYICVLCNKRDTDGQQ